MGSKREIVVQEASRWGWTVSYADNLKRIAVYKNRDLYTEWACISLAIGSNSLNLKLGRNTFSSSITRQGREVVFTRYSVSCEDR